MPLTVGYIQYAPVYAQVETNLATLEERIRGIDADLLVMPELAASGYDFRDRADADQCAEPMGQGPTAEMLVRVAAERKVTLVAGYPERDGELLYNACMLVTPDGRIANYRKIHLFSRETLFFTPGDAPPPVVDTPAGRVGLMICFDWFFPETARLLALQGAQILAHPSNLVLPYCQRAMYARSVENHVFSITANRVGSEEQAGRTLNFTGGSQVLDMQGQVLAKAPEADESTGVAEINPEDADNKALNEFNDLFDDRRTELYGKLLT